MTKEITMTNDKRIARATMMIAAFELRHSFVIRHSSFVMGTRSFIILASEARAA
jgi:hypothetical protein